jgi:hypothetical protein
MADISKIIRENLSLKLTILCFIIIGIVFTSIGFLIYDYIKTPTAAPVCELVPSEEIISGVGDGGIKMDCRLEEPNALGDFAVKYKLYYVFLPFVSLSVLFENPLLKLSMVVLNAAYFFLLGMIFSLIVVMVLKKLKHGRKTGSKKKKRKS